MSNKVKSILLVIGLSFSLSQLSAQANSHAVYATNATTASAPKETVAINWVTLEQAQALNAKSPKRILIDTYTDWCGWCKRLDATTYKDQKIIEYINKNFYAVKLNAEQKEPITFNGKTYNYKGNGDRGMHEVAIYLLSGAASYPTTVFLDKDLSIIAPVPGYMPANEMLLVLKYINTGLYKTVKWEDFQKDPGQYIKS